METLTHYNNLPIHRNWKAAGGKPKPFVFLFNENYKLVQCKTGYVIICPNLGCRNLIYKDKMVCRSHSLGKDIYMNCRHGTCPKIAGFGYEYRQPLFCKEHSADDMEDVKNPKCAHPGCRTQPRFGHPGQKAKFCSVHRLDEMININKRTCVHPECTKGSSYGYEGQPARYCAEHKIPGTVNIYSRRCIHPDCTIRPTYGYEGQSAQYCKQHSPTDTVDVVNRRCKYPGCRTQPRFGHEGQPARFCGRHREATMTDIVSPKCIYDGCKISPSFGLDGGKAQWCATHKPDEAIDVVHTKCIHPNCTTRPTYGYEGEFPKFCSFHKLPETIDLCHNMCEIPHCKIRANFGYEGEEGRFCSVHSLEGMTDITSYRCSFTDCMTHPIFGFEGEKAHRCLIHRDEGMIDLKNKKCEYPECAVRANFGYEGETAKFCLSHSHPEMINLAAPQCEHNGCTIQPSFGYEGQSCTRCREHRLRDMIDVRNIGKQCRRPDCNTRSSYLPLFENIPLHCVNHANLNEFSLTKNNPRCSFIGCLEFAYYVDPNDPNVYPVRCPHHRIDTDIELVRQTCANCRSHLYFPVNKDMCMECGQYRQLQLHKFKEMMVKHLFESNHVSAIHDRRISIDGSRYRPDFLISAPFGYIICEVDEHQHKKDTYAPDAEISRMITLYQDTQCKCPGSQLLIIRFNPDQYEGKQLDTAGRHEYLCSLIKYFQELSTINIQLGVVYLFYDEFDGNPSIQPLALI